MKYSKYLNYRLRRFVTKILAPKQMLQRLQIALVQVKSGNASKKLLNGIRQFIYYLYQAKQITKKYTTIK